MASDWAGSPRVNHLSGRILLAVREECMPRATTKPIAETYPEKGRTFHKNGSTKVPEKEERRCGNRSRKVLIEKKK